MGGAEESLLEGPASPLALLLVGAAGSGKGFDLGATCCTVVVGALVLGLYVNDPAFVLPNSKF